MIKKWILILLLIVFIVINLFYEFRRGDYSNDFGDKKLNAIKMTFVKEDNDYNYQIINNILLDVITYVKNKNLDAMRSTFGKEEYTLNNINDFSVVEIYKLATQETTINYLKVNIEKNNKWDIVYLIIKQDNINMTYSMSISNEEEYNSAKNNNINIDNKFTITKNNYNKYDYDYDFTKIVYRYIKDYYIKYVYDTKEAYKIDNNYRNYNSYMKQRVKLSKISYEDIVEVGKKIEDDGITYIATTNELTYEVTVNSPMNYKIKIY